MCVKGSALADRIMALRAESDKEPSSSSVDEENGMLQQLDEVFYDLQKWVDIEDKKVNYTCYRDILPKCLMFDFCLFGTEAVKILWPSHNALLLMKIFCTSCRHGSLVMKDTVVIRSCPNLAF